MTILDIKKLTKIGVILFLSLMSVVVNASNEECELTSDYKKAREEVRKIVFGRDNDYNRCKDAAHSAAYWVALSNCVKAGDGKNVGGGCAHLVGYGKYFVAPDISHCDVFEFKPNKQLAQSLLNEIVNERGVRKCK